MRTVVDMGIFVSAFIRSQMATDHILPSLRDGRFTAIYATDRLEPTPFQEIPILRPAKFMARL